MALAGEWGIPVASVVTTYSVDENLWGRTAECGPLEDPWVAPPEDAFERTAAPAARPQRADRDRRSRSSAGCRWRSTASRCRCPTLIRALDRLGGSYGFGRVDMIENRRVGIKSRELYEVPGALAIIGAHLALEDLTLEREVAHHKPLLEQRWADLVYDGQWFSPLRAGDRRVRGRDADARERARSGCGSSRARARWWGGGREHVPVRPVARHLRQRGRVRPVRRAGAS